MAEALGKVSEDIYEFLKSVNVPVSKNDLKTPSREFILRTFECFLKDLQIDVTISELRTWEATKHIEDDIYDDSQFLILLAMTVNYISQPCGATMGLNISIRDIVEPKPKRTKKILSHITVFWNYYIQKYAGYHAIETTFKEKLKQAEDLVLQNKLLDEKYNEKFKLLKNMQPSKAELMDAISAKEAKSIGYKKQMVDLQTEYNSLKTEMTDIGNQIRQTEVNVATAKESLEDLSQLILSSPERVNTEIQRLRERIKAEDIKMKEKEAVLKETEKKNQIQDESLKANEKALSSMKNIIEEIEILKENVKKIVADQHELDNEEDKVKKLQLELHQKEESKAHQAQKSLKCALNKRMQRETLITLLQTHQNDEYKESKALESLKVATNTWLERIESKSNYITEIVKKMKEANTITKERKAQHVLRMEEMGNVFEADCDEIIQVVKRKLKVTSKF